MKRIVIIGSSCAGKSTFSKQLAEQLNIKYVELDQLHWLPNWQERADTEFRDLVLDATQGDTWIVDGNYSFARDVIWPNATDIIWLNHSFSRVLYRSITRSIKRVVTKEALFAGNTESFRQTFFSRDSIILWVLKTYHQKRKKYDTLLQQEKYHHLNVTQFTNQKQIDTYFKHLKSSEQ